MLLLVDSLLYKNFMFNSYPKIGTYSLSAGTSWIIFILWFRFLFGVSFQIQSCTLSLSLVIICNVTQEFQKIIKKRGIFTDYIIKKCNKTIDLAKKQNTIYNNFYVNVIFPKTELRGETSDVILIKSVILVVSRKKSHWSVLESHKKSQVWIRSCKDGSDSLDACSSSLDDKKLSLTRSIGYGHCGRSAEYSVVWLQIVRRFIKFSLRCSH